MKKHILFLLFLFPFILAGCNAAVNMNGKVMSVNSGQYFYNQTQPFLDFSSHSIGRVYL